jgi:hypothetical protein
MKKKQIIVFFISFLWLYSLIGESSITSVYACTNFKIKDDQTFFLGNSEDHAFRQISDTFITFVPQGQTWPDGSKLKYGAVVVGYANGSGNSWVQGGMNEKGLAFDSSSVPHTEPNLHDERPPNLVPEIFSCETISEVVEYKKTHGVYQQEGSVQSFYLDKSGESVVFHIGEDGEFSFFRSDESFQLASNFYVDDPSRGNPGSDAIRRFDAAEQVLDDIVENDDLSIESITLVLDAVHFEGSAVNTLYSNIFDVTNGDIYLYFFHQFEEVVKLNLEEELAKGRHAYRISDLFTQEVVDDAFDEYHEFPLVIRVFPTDLILLFATMALDVILVFASMFVVGKRLLHGIDESKNEVLEHGAASRGLYLQMILSLAVIWSFLSFPMIYWNHNGEWWPFFDGIPVLRWPLQPFYAFHNLFLLMSLLGVVLIAFLLSSFASRGEAIRLVKRGLSLGKENIWENMVILGTPALIGVLYLLLEMIDVIPKVDWLMYAIMYPLIVTMLMMLIPLAEKMGIKKQDFPQDRSGTNLLKASVLLILTWGLWFLPLLLTGIVDHMYVLLLVNLSISIIILTLRARRRITNFSARAECT